MGEHLSAGPVLGPAVDDPMMVTPPVKRSWTTLGGFFSYLQKKGIGLNVASYIGAGQVRASAMGYQAASDGGNEDGQGSTLIRQHFGADARAFLVPLLLVQVAAVSAGAGLIVASCTAKYRDLQHVLPLVVQVWLYLTPVIYPLSKVPARWQWAMALNPLAP